MNPMEMLRLKTMLAEFGVRHPKFPGFLKNAADGLDPGGSLEMTVKNSKGQKMSASIRVTQQDIQLLRELRQLLENK